MPRGPASGDLKTTCRKFLAVTGLSVYTDLSGRRMPQRLKA